MFTNFISVISTIITIYIARNNIFTPKKLSVYEKQLYNVYLPIFTYIEPYLYKEDTPIEVINTLVSKFNCIQANHYELIDSNLLNDFLILKTSINNSEYNYYNYESFCFTLDKLFEKSRKHLSLPTRNFFYKLNNDQYPTSSRAKFQEFQGIAIKCSWLLTLGIFTFIGINLFKVIWTFILNHLILKA